MKKVLSIMVMMLCVISMHAVTKKTTASSEKAVVINKAKTWFKKNYVAHNFKDPYSYRLVKITATKKSAREETEKSLKRLREELESNGFSVNHDWNKYIDSLQTVIHDADSIGIAYLISFGRTSDKEEQKRIWAKKREFNDISRQANAKWEKAFYFQGISSVYNRDLDSLQTDTELNAQWWEIYIECYGKNGYGNLVLSRYTFDYATSWDDDQILRTVCGD